MKQISSTLAHGIVLSWDTLANKELQDNPDNVTAANMIFSILNNFMTVQGNRIMIQTLIETLDKVKEQ